MNWEGKSGFRSRPFDHGTNTFAVEGRSALNHGV